MIIVRLEFFMRSHMFWTDLKNSTHKYFCMLHSRQQAGCSSIYALPFIFLLSCVCVCVCVSIRTQNKENNNKLFISSLPHAQIVFERRTFQSFSVCLSVCLSVSFRFIFYVCLGGRLVGWLVGWFVRDGCHK